MGQKTTLWDRLRPNGEWELVKWTGGKMWAIATGGSSMVTVTSWLVGHLRGLHIDLVGLAILFLLTLLVILALLFTLKMQGKPLSDTNDDQNIFEDASTAPDWVLNGYASEEEYNDKEHQIRTLGTYAAGVLSTHRMSAICLAIKLSKLHERFGPRPLMDPRYDVGTREGLEEGLLDFYARVGPWETKFHTAYITDFHGQVVSVVHGFGNEGISDLKLNKLLSEEVNADTAARIADHLATLALRTEGLKVIAEDIR